MFGVVGTFGRPIPSVNGPDADHTDRSYAPSTSGGSGSRVTGSSTPEPISFDIAVVKKTEEAVLAPEVELIPMYSGLYPPTLLPSSVQVAVNYRPCTEDSAGFVMVTAPAIRTCPLASTMPLLS